MHAKNMQTTRSTATRVIKILEELAAILKMHTPRALKMA
jgi:flagellin-specific chaperone FliS